MAKKGTDRSIYLLVFSGISIAVILAVYFLVGRPVMKYAADVRNDFNLKQKKVQEAQELVRTIPNPQEALNAIKGKVAEIQETSPGKKQVPKLMQLLSQTALDRAITVVSLRPRDDTHTPDAQALAGGFNKLYMEMVVICTYQQLAEFVNGLSLLPVSFNIESMSVEKNQPPQGAPDAKQASKVSTDAPELQVTLVLSTIFG